MAIDNGPARKERFSLKLQQIGEDLGDPFEVSTLRREVSSICLLSEYILKLSIWKESLTLLWQYFCKDFNFVCGKSEYEDVIQCNNLPSSSTPRGHQFPCAFLVRVSGLDKVMTTWLWELHYNSIYITLTTDTLGEIVAWSRFGYSIKILSSWYCWIVWTIPWSANRITCSSTSRIFYNPAFITWLRCWIPIVSKIRIWQMKT